MSSGELNPDFITFKYLILIIFIGLLDFFDQIRI